MEQVIVIGAGIAGMAAAADLAREGQEVTLLEARERFGGRIHTVCSRIGNLPIELGAEFVHGAKNQLWQVLRTAGLETQEVPPRHWQASAAGLKEDKESWSELEKVFSQIDPQAPDRDLASFLQVAGRLSRESRQFALEYVEGFHAADARRVSIHSVARAEQAAQADEGDRQFRIACGYLALVDWFQDQLKQTGVEVRLGTVVDSVAWQPGKVELAARTRAGRERLRAGRVVVTVPLGVLQAQGLGGLAFVPRLPKKEQAVHALAMGAVVKISFQFRARFWPVENFGFIHANGKAFPTWWADQRGPLLTAWSGGPRAQAMAGQPWEAIQNQAIRVLAEIFHQDPREIEDLMIGACHHDWSQDPFARGAYSYTPVGAEAMIPQLAAPVGDTLFFAGEATDSQGEQGTVQAALASGRRAAREILEARTAQPALR